MKCKNCGLDKKQNRKWQKFCCDKCRNDYWNNLKMKAMKKYMAEEGKDGK